MTPHASAHSQVSKAESSQEDVATGSSVPQARKTVIATHREESGDPGTSASDRILTFTVPDPPRGSSQILIGWVPGRGNDRNATATDAVEW